MNVTKDNASTALLTDTVPNFSVALAATQETLCTNNATITAMQIQPQMRNGIILHQQPAPSGRRGNQQGCNINSGGGNGGGSNVCGNSNGNGNGGGTYGNGRGNSVGNWSHPPTHLRAQSSQFHKEV